MTRIAFTADLHVDSYGTRIDPETGLNARLGDFLRTTRWVAEEASRRGCEALVVAGDFTERRHPAPWLVSQIRDALEIVPTPGLRYYLRGNHDGEIAGGSIVTILDDGLTTFGLARPEVLPVAGDPTDAVLAFIPFLDRHWLRTQPGFETVPDAEIYQVLGEQFLTIARGLYAQAKAEAEWSNAGVVLVCHQTLAGAEMSDTQRAFLGDLALVVDARALQAIGFEAVVAGHLHRHQVVLGDRIAPVGSQLSYVGPVLYTGSIERVDFGEEHETKGFVVADVGPGTFDWHFVEAPARRFVTVGTSTGEVIQDALLPALVEGAIVRVLDVPADADVVAIRKAILEAGAFEVMEIRRRPLAGPEGVGGMAEDLTAEQALDEYFVDEPDREQLVERGREILAHVG